MRAFARLEASRPRLRAVARIDTPFIPAAELLLHPGGMSLIATLLAFVAYAYFRRIRRFPSPRHIAAGVIGVYAAYVVYVGFTLAVGEEARARYGVTTPGVVTTKLSSTGDQGSKTIGRRWYKTVRTSHGFTLHQTLARLVLTGTVRAWVIDYQYTSLSTGRRAFSRDFIPREQWNALRAGSPVNVRQVRDGIGSSVPRVEGSDQRYTALFEVVFGGALLAIAAMLGGVFRRGASTDYVEVPATVLGVTPVEYRDGTYWHVRFAFFDRRGEPHEITDEFVTTTWKVGDAGIVKYDVANPRDAVLRPAEGA